MKKLAWLLLIIMLFAFTANAEVLRLPQGLTRIEAEAFMGDASVTAVEIPDSVTSIGEAAFDPGVQIVCGMDSYAYGYAREHGYDIKLTGNYAISELWMEDGSVCATVDADRACTLRIEYLSDDMSRTLATQSLPLEGGLSGATVTHNAPASLPQDFALRASLRDPYDYLIGDPCLCLDYTSAHRQFEEKTPADFPDGYIQHFGANTGDFGVLADSVIIVTGAAQGSGYRVVSGTTLHSGDAIYVENERSLLKVGSVSKNADGSWFVVPAADAAFEDFYQFIRYSESIDAVEALGDDVYAAAALSKTFNSSLDEGIFSGKLTAGVSVNCDIEMDRALFPDGYIKCKIYAAVSGHVEYTLGGEGKVSTAIPLFSGSVPTSVPGLLVDLSLSLPLGLSAEAGATVSNDFSLKGGMVYNTQNGVTPIREGSWTYAMEVEGKLEGNVGVRLDIDLSAMRVMALGVGAEVGMKATAHAKSVDLSTEAERIHACQLCFDFALDRYITLDVHGEVRILGENEGGMPDRFAKSFPLRDLRLFDGYVSVINEKESVHGGKIVMAAGECPNYKYKTTIKVINEAGKERAREVTLYRSDPAPQAMNVAETFFTRHTAWLYPGAYRAETVFPGTWTSSGSTPEQTVQKSFLVTDKAQDVVLSIAPEPTPTPIVTPTPAPTPVPTSTPLPEPTLPDQPITGPVDTTSDIPITAAYFPDPAFRLYLQQNVDGTWDPDAQTIVKDGFLSWNERQTGSFNYSGKDSGAIHDLTGIQYFPYLKYFSMEDCALATLDLSGFTSLESVHISNDSCLTDLNLNGCTGLDRLNIVDCDKLSSTSVKHCQYLRFIDFYQCGLTALDASDLPHLEKIGVRNCEDMAYLNVRGCSALTELTIQGNALRALDASDLPEVKSITISNNTRYTLTAHNCPALTYVNIQDLDQCEMIDLSGCTALKEFSVYGEAIQRADFSGCTALTSLSLSAKDRLNELDMDGCANLETFKLSGGSLDHLTLTDKAKLSSVCIENITAPAELDLHGLTALQSAKIAYTTLRKLDLSGCTALAQVNLGHNDRLEEISLEGCISWTGTQDGGNALVSESLMKINLKDCKALEALNIWNPKLTELDLRGCTALTTINCSNTLLQQLDVSTCTNLQTLTCSNSYLTSLDVSDLQSLESLFCSNNQLIELVINGCKNLNHVSASENAFKFLDARNCPALTESSLYCDFCVEVIWE